MLFKIKGFIPYIIVVFLNAFIDLGHKIIVQNTIFKIYDGQYQIILTAIVNALILMPFVMLLTPSGYCSDKYSKNIVMKITSMMAVVLTIMITIFYYAGWFWPAFAMTFLLAVQSAFYSPAKYGYIKELVGDACLAKANGVVQATTTISILLGIFVFSVLFEKLLVGKSYQNTGDVLEIIAMSGWVLIILSVFQLIIAWRLPKTNMTDQQLRFNWQQYISGAYLKLNVRAVLEKKLIKLSIVGLSLFLAISQVMLAAFPAYAKESLNIDNTVIIQGAMACAAFGIMLGALVAGQISKHNIETRLLPFSVIGIAFCLFLLPYLPNAYFQSFNFLFWGFCGGLLLTPYNALIQYYASENTLGRILAGNNFMQNVTMLFFLAMTVSFAFFGVDSEDLFIVLLLIALLIALPVAFKVKAIASKDIAI